MIQGFSTIVQEDALLIADYVRGKGKQDPEQNKRVALAGLRMVAVLGMAFAGILVLSALSSVFTATLTVGTLFKLTLAAALYAFNHDVFVMAKNATNQMSVIPEVAHKAKAFFEDLKDFFKGKKDDAGTPHHPLTDGTFFRPVWDRTFAEIAQEA